ncbi:MAG: hypothetical protein A3C85_02435 [Candidatus Doudnabacteria bacterium RIFCSPHIGHO2_02_FULL_48_21]|uniref:Nudix hydrolase domain-containing protein n=1 Tax=Candidatus Doudnabacteria bacterium RIFCSPLOWO2_02_FULL_48_13 TaxID=1817845 RepID=A0A1F5QCH8_9BACT|nr:MAG: hypothetical protein A3K05_01490 [Candidatus Doudnabacteria bacterium RIFCSPHIGHO2_01_48_18]OGE79797.1 MAG: hypothetical protein A2668_02215 [Candidatus Doudnabacteria bacterium RIFCSPHIGHO2_01_FULL_48_180]OGE91528.1 MAG: hypothetical protein A3F44_02420 [Candidatus Doudnabacteria bacterium RIFCSPHIGHO2_12_FULL_47_25]OGE93996.1 MAG: hypothetical protein A3C85_02435 [Candidatus Doudnabacteria bacterium RIFCSPHIGHO2_02_FULL_48_21]OGE98030.1 MAG: hypothetical protein A3A83_02640 [Candidatu
MKIPENAKRVFKGEVFEIYQWDQKMFDGSTKTFEMAKRPDTVLVILTANGKILVAKEEQPNFKRDFGFAGGKVDDGEEPLIAAKRELMEEAGMQSDDWELLKTYEPFNRVDWNIHVFVARNAVKVREHSQESGEKIEFYEMDFDEFADKVSLQEWGEFANEILRMKLDGRLEEFKLRLFPQ